MRNSVDPATNKLVGYQFDNAGNTKTDANNQTFIYDAENKQVQVSNPSGVVGNYFYDGDGKRIKKYVPSTGETTIFVYDAGGKSIAEYSTIVTPASQAKVSYLTSDHLGSPRINTDATGVVIARHDYHPFGEEIIGTGGRTAGLGYASDNVRKKFTGYERDNESSLDFAEARMYAFSNGRFSTPDPLLSSGRPTGPQTWNRYVYVLNNPLALTDPDGLYECKGSTDECSALRRSLADAKETLKRVKKDYGVDSKEYKDATAALEAYGCESKGGNCIDANGKTLTDANGNALKDSAGNVMVDFTHQGGGARTTLNGDTINISLNKNFTDSDPLYQGVLGNEGSHITQINAFMESGRLHAMSRWVQEYESFFVQAVINEAVVKNQGGSDYSLTVNPVKGQTYDIAVWHKSWEGPDKSVIRANRRDNIQTVLTDSKEYLLRPPNSAPRPAPRGRRTR